MKRINHKLVVALLAASAFTSCTDSFDCIMDNLQKPDEVAVNEELNKYDVLKTYINANTPSFLLGAKATASDFAKRDIIYSAIVTNFNAVDLSGSFTPVGSFSNDAYDLAALQSAATVASEAPSSITVYGGDLVSDQNQRAAYLNELLKPVFVPFVPEKGRTKILDFENDDLGKQYAMSGNSKAVVENDPEKESGHVLHVGTDAQKAAYSYPKFHIKLPEGRKLGDYTKLYIDLRFVNNDGIWGSGLHLFINGTDFPLGGNGADFCGGGNKWKREGVIKLNDPAKFGCDLSAYKDLTEFDLQFGAGSGGAQYFVDNITMDYEVAGGGYTDITNFEKDAVGKSYTMSGSSTATVEADPTGEVGGKVLHVGTDAQKAAYSYPKFHVVLPAGMTLGDYTAFYVDMRFVNNDGIWGSGLHLFINGVDYPLGGNGADFCGGGNKWKIDGMVKLNDATKFGCVLSDEHKNLHEFDLQFGAGSGAAQYYLDNLKLYWKAADKYIEKTPEEKKQILEGEMEKWIGGMIAAGQTEDETKSVKVWNIVSEPLSKAEDANTFHWSQYLGKDEYVRRAVKMARDTAKTALQLYVSNTFDQTDASADLTQMAADLQALVSSWEADKVTVIDGYNLLLTAICPDDDATLQHNKDVIKALFEKMAQAGKPVRVSDLRVNYADGDGNKVKASNLTVAQWKTAADFMAYIIQTYRATIPADKQAGISLSGIGTGGDYDIMPWTSAYNRTYMYEGVVNGLSK
jgi:hypothetical protein